MKLKWGQNNNGARMNTRGEYLNPIHMVILGKQNFLLY